jgi:hypothetical protein
MVQLPSLTASGFLATQISNFSSSGCSGLTAYQMGNITDVCYQGFGDNCISSIPPHSFEKIDLLQVQNLSPFACGGIGREQMNNITAAAFGGFSEQQIANFSSAGCSGLNAGQMEHINSVSFSAFTRQCIQEIDASAFSQITAQQVAELSPDTFSGIFPLVSFSCSKQSSMENKLQPSRVLQHLASQWIKYPT